MISLLFGLPLVGELGDNLVTLREEIVKIPLAAP
jgi:hypothetical protein